MVETHAPTAAATRSAIVEEHLAADVPAHVDPLHSPDLDFEHAEHGSGVVLVFLFVTLLCGVAIHTHRHLLPVPYTVLLLILGIVLGVLEHYVSSKPRPLFSIFV